MGARFSIYELPKTAFDKPVPKRLRQVLVGDDGVVYLPCDGEAMAMCALYDGVAAPLNGQFFAPGDWMAENYPRLAEPIAKLSRHARQWEAERADD